MTLYICISSKCILPSSLVNITLRNRHTRRDVKEMSLTRAFTARLVRSPLVEVFRDIVCLHISRYNRRDEVDECRRCKSIVQTV